jgi:hypothetical protein
MAFIGTPMALGAPSQLGSYQGMRGELMSSEPKNLAASQAKAILDQEKKDRAKRCEEKINRALQEERCGLDVAVVITARGNVPQLNILAQD